MFTFALAISSLVTTAWSADFDGLDLAKSTIFTCGVVVESQVPKQVRVAELIEVFAHNEKDAAMRVINREPKNIGLKSVTVIGDGSAEFPRRYHTTWELHGKLVGGSIKLIKCEKDAYDWKAFYRQYDKAPSATKYPDQDEPNGVR